MITVHSFFFTPYPRRIALCVRHCQASGASCRLTLQPGEAASQFIDELMVAPGLLLELLPQSRISYLELRALPFMEGGRRRVT